MLDFRPHKLQIKKTSGGGYNEQGNPIPVEVTWSEEIPCHYATNNREEIYSYIDGKFVVFDYQIWIDPIEEDLTAKFVKLTNQYGEVIVEDKQVQKCVNRQLRTKLFL